MQQLKIPYLVKSAPSIVCMAKVDIESILKFLKSTLNTFYMDAVLPMGCASSCANFESFSTAIEWVAEHKRF